MALCIEETKHWANPFNSNDGMEAQLTMLAKQIHKLKSTRDNEFINFLDT